MVSLHVGLYNPTPLFCCFSTVIIFFIQITPLANPLSIYYPPILDYTSFESGDVNMEGDAYIVQEVIQVTLNSLDQNDSYSVGRVTSNMPVHLWDQNSRQLTDFATRFSFLIYSDKAYYGDGMTFFLADPKLPFQKFIQEGGGLGLVDGDQLLNSTQHSFMAVEFDTFKNSWNPQGNHVGLNFNSMNSTITKPWVKDITETRVCICSIEYNSSTHNLSISFTGDSGYLEEYISYKVDLRDYLPEWVIVGFSAATGSLFEVHTLRSWSFSSNLQGHENVPNPKTPTAGPPIPSLIFVNEHNIGSVVILGICIGVIVSLLILVCSLLWKRSSGKKEELAFDLIMGDELQKGTSPRRLSYNELASVTNKFAESNKLGQGGFGSVYKGHLKDLNTSVAIKRISRESTQGIKEYATEVKIISQLRHRNLVQLIGWCHKKNDLLLIYEFMPNGSLDSHLYGGKSLLVWPIRYNIALGLASALLYLQEEWEQCVIHRDIKSSNVMLDSCFSAKLSDFGLARLVDHKKGSKTTLIAGTRGYLAPEYIASGKDTKESDKYSLGVVLLEIASGKKPLCIGAEEELITVVEWVWELYGMGKSLKVADPKLCGDFDEQQMERVVGVGLWCVYPDYSFRPSIRQVIQVLKFEAPLPILPEKMPVSTYLPPSIRSLLCTEVKTLVVINEFSTLTRHTAKLILCSIKSGSDCLCDIWKILLFHIITYLYSLYCCIFTGLLQIAFPLFHPALQ